MQVRFKHACKSELGVKDDNDDNNFKIGNEELKYFLLPLIITTPKSGVISKWFSHMWKQIKGKNDIFYSTINKMVNVMAIQTQQKST